MKAYGSKIICMFRIILLMPRIKILVNMMRMLHSKYFILAVFIISKKTEQHLEWSKCENVVFSFWYPLPKHKAYTNFTNNLLCNQFLRKEKISNIYLQYAVLLVKTYYHNYTIRYLILVHFKDWGAKNIKLNIFKPNMV